MSNYEVFDSVVISPKQSYNYTFDGTGAYPYHDAINQSIKGTIEVMAVDSLINQLEVNNPQTLTNFSKMALNI